ncbi:hypothetical protein [Hymenobacter sp. BT559]|jgi:hypothetical protein|uniref:hypothetical protein n=1 Tax=Hymenobacter sp. BT559 TaxID=2795729 RepID=UPI002574752A|nr:hypothetical protein [Hymenobacter sp. BT559]
MRGFTLVPLAVLLAACNSATTTQTIPSISFSTQINITNQQYQALRFDNGVVALPATGINGGGVKGLLVVRLNAGTYLAFDRNCPYQPYDACSTVSLDRSRLFFRDSCCTSQFDFRGNVTGGPARRPLRQYTTSLSGSLLTISN